MAAFLKEIEKFYGTEKRISKVRYEDIFGTL